MGKIKRFFTENEIKILKSNLSIPRVSEKNITYSPAFKIAAVQAQSGGAYTHGDLRTGRI